jgi:hypothetical protein
VPGKSQQLDFMTGQGLGLGRHPPGHFTSIQLHLVRDGHQIDGSINFLRRYEIKLLLHGGAAE